MRKAYPSWLKKRIPGGPELKEVELLLKDYRLNTVCQSAFCPNLGECFANKTATFLLLGNICTRNCLFCAVSNGFATAPDPEEPGRVAAAVVSLNLNYVVLTSVTRDDLQDGGADHYSATIREIKRRKPEIIIEVLTPDFAGKLYPLGVIAQTEIKVFNHNLETVPRLYEKVRPQAVYSRSLRVLARMKELRPDILTKSGIMVGLGEKPAEVRKVMEDLREINCDILTIGQYLAPSEKHLPVTEFIHPGFFNNYEVLGEKLGFKAVVAGPFVRSSYRAEVLIISAEKIGGKGNGES